MAEKEDITGFILAGGLSRRMLQNKSLMEFRNKPLISHAIDILTPVCTKVILSANTDVFDFTGCEVWPDNQDFQAPMAGIYNCLQRSETDWNIFFTCDMPLMDSRLFRYLIRSIGPVDIVLPRCGEGIEPLCALYGKSCLPELSVRVERQQYGLQQMIPSCRHVIVEITPGLDFYRPDLFFNVNTPEDFNRLVSMQDSGKRM